MTIGKIVYTPLATSALRTASSNWLSCVTAGVGDPGTGSFGIDIVAKVSSVSDLWYPLINTSAGWPTTPGYMATITSTRQVTFTLTDGTHTVALSSAAGVVPTGSWFYLRIDIDRAGLGTIYVDGMLVASGSVTAVTGSITADALGVYSGIGTNPLDLALVRIDVGRSLSAEWVAQEWDRLRYGIPVTQGDFTTTWSFNQTMVDLSGVFTFSPTTAYSWIDGFPYALRPITYPLPFGANWGHNAEYIDADDIQRTIDGTLHVARGPRKRHLSMSFECDRAQKVALEGAWAGGNLLSFFERDSQPASLVGYMAQPPTVQSLFEGYFQVDLEVQER
jgi:hypothetical protein